MIPPGAISADSHVTEPPNCYTDFIDPKYKEDAPHIVQEDSGRQVFKIKDLKMTVPLGLADGAGYSIEERTRRTKSMKFDETRRSGWDGKARMADQARDGIAAEIIYATVGMVLCTHPDSDYKKACMDAYNRWLQSFCDDGQGRLFGLAQTPVIDVDSAIDDVRRAKEMGMVGMMMPGNPVYEDYDHADYDALWECAADLGMPICFHILTSQDGDIASVFKSQRGHALNGFLRIIRAVQDVVGILVLGGVFERHPHLKMVCAEADAGWLPHFMYRMDHAANFNVTGGILPGLSKLPSEYIRSNVWATFQDDWVAFQVKELLDPQQLIWANDFPHSDSTWPNSQALLEKHTKNLSEAERQAIMRDNVAELFNLPAGSESWRMPSSAM